MGVALILLVTIVGTVLAVFTAAFVSHLIVHTVVPSRHEFTHMLRVSFGALTAIVLPIGFLLLAGLQVWSLALALRVSALTLVATLGLAGFLAVRRAQIPFGQKLVILAAEVVLGALVVALELAVHG